MWCDVIKVNNCVPLAGWILFESSLWDHLCYIWVWKTLLKSKLFFYYYRNLILSKAYVISVIKILVNVSFVLL